MTLTEALQNAFIEKDHPQFCTVYLKGEPDNDHFLNGPKVIGLEHVGRTDYEIIEEAYTAYSQNGRA